MISSNANQAIHDTLLAVQNDLTEYKQYIYRRYEDAPHLSALDVLLMQVTLYVETGGKEGIGRAIVEMPPRHGKTLTVSRLYPTWHLGRNPDHRAMLVSYGQDLANKNSRAARNIIRSPHYQAIFPGTQLAPDSASVAAWDIAAHDGGVDALGIGGGATGKGAHLLILDDLIKSRKEAESETYRNAIWDASTDDLYTRLEPGGAIVMMFTRWHEDDPIGRALERMPHEQWHRLTLPALAEDNDPLGRETGAALWPDRYPLETLETIRETLGSYSFSALYQQSPLPAGGGLFKTERIEALDYTPDCTRVVRFYDLAVTAKRSADYTAGIKLGVTSDERFVILDVYRAQKEFPDVHEAIVQNATVDGRDVHIRLEAEKAGIIGLDYLLRDSRMRPYTIDKRPPEGDKYTRALPFAARIEAGRVAMVRAEWNHALINELRSFPRGAHDDLVDALSGAYGMLSVPEPLFEVINIQI